MFACLVCVFPTFSFAQDFLCDASWQFRRMGDNKWLPATVPGTVHTDLMALGLLPDPFVGTNEDSVRWVEKEAWEYRTTFTVDCSHTTSHHHRLAFDGLDTFADVYLNGNQVLTADNMHRRWSVDVPVRHGKNELRILFHSPVERGTALWDSLPFPYEASNDYSERGGQGDRKLSVTTRKAGYHYGWDWGPRILTSGIWRPVHLECWQQFLVQDVYHEQRSVSKDSAQLVTHLEILSDTTLYALPVNVSFGDSLCATKEVMLRPGINHIEVPYTITNPKLWWCNGAGEAYLYNVSTFVGDSYEDTKAVGLRDLRLVQKKDSFGTSFYFELNGQPVFAYGANHIPLDVFLPRVTEEKYRHILGLAAQSGMNMLRVWGGGVYEDERFYHLCDSLGLMVWQDFMFACAMYPFDGKLADNISLEATDALLRLRQHPCIALWCGNNECQDAWMGWGWKRRAERRDPAMADAIWAQYVRQYHEVLPALVEKYTTCSYVPSSPFSRIDARASEDEGDFHYWEPWQGAAPLSAYESKRARFFSEYGFESYPCRQTLLTICPDTTQWYLGSPVMSSHQRATNGDANLVRSLDEYGLKWQTFDEFITATQVLQAVLMQRTVDAHRQSAPYTMGSLIWQLSDCWPGASWSLIDYYGRVKYLPQINE